MSLFRTNLKGPARAFLNMLTTTEKESWDKLKEVYIHKFKTERDVRAKQCAKEQCASFKQKPDETLKAYGERAMELRQLIEANEESFLVHRFLKGIRDKAIRQLLAVGPDDMAKVTVAHLNTRIGNLLRAGEESDGSDGESGDSSDDSSEETDSDSDPSARRRKRKNKKKAGKGKKDRKDLEKAMRVIGNLEERIKKMEAGGQADTFAAQAAYAPNATNYRRGNGANDGSRTTPNNQYQGGGQQNTLPESYVCYNCGNPGHLYRFCPEPKYSQGGAGRPAFAPTPRQGQNWGPRGRPVVFPGENGPQSMVWVENPPNGLAPGYYPVEGGGGGKKESVNHENANKGGRKSDSGPARESGRITELSNTASVDLVSSAARKMTIRTDVVRYVNAVEEAYAGERRRRVENDAGSSEAPTRTRIRLGEPVGPDPESSRTRARTPPPVVPIPPVVERPAPQVVPDTEETEEIPRAEPMRKKRPAVPKPPRHIRMMIERPGYDVVAEFRDLPVSNLKWGMLMDIAPALRRQVGTGLLLERQARKAKGKGKAPAGHQDPMDILGVYRGERGKEPCTNFYTIATLTVNRRHFRIEKVMIDAGSVVNLASIDVLEKLGAWLFPVHNLTIRTATSALTEI